LFGVILAGVGLCAAHFRGEYLRWREHGAAERRKELRMRRLYGRGMTLADPESSTDRERYDDRSSGGHEARSIDS
jgi:hypothetical protein